MTTLSGTSFMGHWMFQLQNVKLPTWRTSLLKARNQKDFYTWMLKSTRGLNGHTCIKRYENPRALTVFEHTDTENL